MKLYLVRHAQSLKNKDGLDRTAETPLSDTGFQQAKIVAKRLVGKKIDLIYSSTLTRAKQTAEIIAGELFIPVENWRHLIEVNSLVESFDQLNDRAEKILEHLLSKHREQNLICVSHATMIETIIAKMIFGSDLNSRILQKIRQHFGTTNTGISLCEYTDAEGWMLQVFNDSSHL